MVKLHITKDNPILNNSILGEMDIQALIKGILKNIEISNSNGDSKVYPITSNLLDSVKNCIETAKEYAPNLICGHFVDKKGDYICGDDTLKLALLEWEDYRLVQKIDLREGKYVFEKEPVVFSGIGAIIDMDDNFGRNSKVYILPNGRIYEEEGRDSILEKDPAEE